MPKNDMPILKPFNPLDKRHLGESVADALLHGRYQGMMPQWDCLHPGRAWAKRLQPCASTSEQLAEKVKQYLGNGNGGI